MFKVVAISGLIEVDSSACGSRHSGVGSEHCNVQVGGQLAMQWSALCCRGNPKVVYLINQLLTLNP